ncbi:hypothetical protein [Ascidiaceihabitans sp.]|uniref:hypothetical protein n=1 Tax=Ascidiaceihabitans sp. TaxID=1872644 RepID=UPI003298DFFD
MAVLDHIQWFKDQFFAEMAQATQDTVFDPDMLCALAFQETGSIWGVLRKKAGLSPEDVVRLCCGDTLDAPNRRAFPKTRAHLDAAPKGAQMFQIARTALLDMAAHIDGYKFAFKRPDKFCHGFGVFQYDIQFFKTNPDYFLNREYEAFSGTLHHAMVELKSCLKKRGLQDRTSITDAEFLTIAITYNTGRYRASKGLKQGHQSGGKFYGEHMRDYLAIARRLPNPDLNQAKPVPAGTAVVDKPMALRAFGRWMHVETMTTSLRLRMSPKISQPLTKNVVAELPCGWPVRSFGESAVDGFEHIEVEMGGTVFHGYAASQYLKDGKTPVVVPKVAGGAMSPVEMPRKAGTVTTRMQNANAHSLNEAKMPGRTGSTPDTLRDDLAGIVNYLNPAQDTHVRYQPRAGLTFCNIYAHDFCALAGAYLPRVWWTADALAAMQAGHSVAPRYGNTIREMRANDLFRWLVSYGQDFGWRRVSTPTDVQHSANLGAVALIIARRKDDGRSGHVSMVVPEGAGGLARRLSDGSVSAPLQSQAGSTNFNYSAGRTDWWKATKFADSALWVHA